MDTRSYSQRALAWWRALSKNKQASFILLFMVTFFISIPLTGGATLYLALCAIVWLVVRFLLLEDF